MLNSIIITNITNFSTTIVIFVVLLAVILVIESLAIQNKKKSIVAMGITIMIAILFAVYYAFNVHVISRPYDARIRDGQVVQSVIGRNPNEIYSNKIKSFGKITVKTIKTDKYKRAIVDRSLKATKITRYQQNH